jgi:uncharacterized membrane protein YkoI
VEANQALGAAKLTFAQALETAGKEVKDGKSFKIELEMKAGRPTYEVVWLQGDKLMKTVLDAASGKVLKTAEWQAKGEKKESGEENEGDEAGEHAGHRAGKAQQAIAAAKITFAQALETAGKEVKGGQVLGIALGLDDGKPVYTLEVLQGEKVTKTRVDAVDGKVLKSVEMKLDKEEADELAESKAALGTVKVPFAQALELAAKEVKDGKVLKAELEMEKGGVMYEVVLLQGDKLRKATLDVASGKVLKVEEQRGKHEQKAEENDEEEDHEEHGAKVAPQTESAEGGTFRQEFKVDKANWVDHGPNPYFILEPGHRWRYKHGAVVLTITVLAETKLVDGVTTRIIEEREEKDGQPLEVSRNYFAIDKGTGDVYYFGEDVDEYKDGKVFGHEGGWLAGADGAKFGLMMPGQIKVGDKFYQEIAPKTAMDRAEIVSLDEKVETPAGKYDKCLHVKETTPLEKDVGHKWYAPGVGLVRDDEFVLEAFEKPKP